MQLYFIRMFNAAYEIKTNESSGHYYQAILSENIVKYYEIKNIANYHKIKNIANISKYRKIS